jgi:hypothetical protein
MCGHGGDGFSAVFGPISVWLETELLHTRESPIQDRTTLFKLVVLANIAVDNMLG